MRKTIAYIHNEQNDKGFFSRGINQLPGNWKGLPKVKFAKNFVHGVKIGKALNDLKFVTISLCRLFLNKSKVIVLLISIITK